MPKPAMTVTDWAERIELALAKLKNESGLSAEKYAISTSNRSRSPNRESTFKDCWAILSRSRPG
jgi:hypothetical protein